MSSYDTVMVPCPKCGHREEAQSKSGDCDLEVYHLEAAPPDVLLGISHAHFECGRCGTKFRVHIQAFGRSVPVDPRSYDDDAEECGP